MRVRAKFVVVSITSSLHWDRTKGSVANIKLQPVTDESEENERFYEVTPSGAIDLSTLNHETAAYFELGQEYYADFTKADE